jgi:DeoR family fructose operon transcriptional repressor
VTTTGSGTVEDEAGDSGDRPYAGADAGRPAARTPYAAQRQQSIIQTLRADRRVDVARIADLLGVTTETVRKDLIRLERQGLLRRVHGGAIPVDQLSFEPDVSARVDYAAQKERIARAALNHVPPQGAVLLDAGSTTARLADMFPTDRPLTVFTNTLPIALSLVTRPNLTVFTLGGRVRSRTLAEVDSWAARTLAEIHVDVAFMGTNGISTTRGLTTPDPAEAGIKRLMLSAARTRILLADHSKLGLVSLCKYGDLADIDLLITDAGLPDDHLAALRAAGPDVERT